MEAVSLALLGACSLLRRGGANMGAKCVCGQPVCAGLVRPVPLAFAALCGRAHVIRASAATIHTHGRFELARCISVPKSRVCMCVCVRAVSAVSAAAVTRPSPLMTCTPYVPSPVALLALRSVRSRCRRSPPGWRTADVTGTSPHPAEVGSAWCLRRQPSSSSSSRMSLPPRAAR